jgi:hypothetical protein
VHFHDQGNEADERHRRDVAHKIETEVVVERSVDRVRRHAEQQRVAVRRRAHHRFGRDIAAGARPVVDDDSLAQAIRQPLADHAGDDVGRAAGRNLDDEAHRLRRIRLRACGV